LPLSTSEPRSGARYPDTAAARDRWILERRPPRHDVDVSRAVASFVEPERIERGEIVDVATLFLSNRECPWRCLMCDLWKNTTQESAPPGAIAGQIRRALAELPRTRRVKLYNSGSFFDPGAIPPEEHDEIALLLSGFERVIVESHPALIGDACWRLRDRLAGELEVAMGLETVHPQALEALNKRMTVDDFGRASARLRAEGVSVRAFVLLGIPFVSADESLHWTCRSIETALDLGATAVSVIPTRLGNGALDALQERGDFVPPDLHMLEAASAFGVRLGRARVFADLWDLRQFSRCDRCLPARTDRLRRQNLAQEVAHSIDCDCSGSRS
jgi:archaeosine synthase beta-subunit